MMLFVSDVNVLFGFGERQTAGSFSNSALKGSYGGYATNPVAFAVNVFSGEFAADGSSPTGNITGTVDMGASSRPIPGASFNATYSISSAPTKGMRTVKMTSLSGR